MKLRRLLALTLIVLGAVLWWMAPETVSGLVLIGIGVVIELLGLVLERRR